MSVPENEKTVIRDLARQVAEIAALPVQDEKKNKESTPGKKDRDVAGGDEQGKHPGEEIEEEYSCREDHR